MVHLIYIIKILLASQKRGGEPNYQVDLILNVSIWGCLKKIFLTLSFCVKLRGFLFSTTGVVYTK